jgi:hypothetical protein
MAQSKQVSSFVAVYVTQIKRSLRLVQYRNELNSQKLCVTLRLLCVPLRLKTRSFLRKAVLTTNR